MIFTECVHFYYTHAYSKCSKNSNHFLVLFSNKMLVIKAENCNLLVRIANREDPDQTAFSGSALSVKALLAGN